MDINTIRSLVIVLSLVAFLGIVFWAWSAKRQPAFDEAAQLPFADDEESAVHPEKGARP